MKRTKWLQVIVIIIILTGIISNLMPEQTFANDLSKNPRKMTNLVIFVRPAGHPEFVSGTTIDPIYIGTYESKRSGYKIFNDEKSSMKAFFKANSYGQLEVETIFASASATRMASYQDFESTITPQNIGEVMQRAIRAVEKNLPNSVNLDSNGDGEVDNVTFLFSGEHEVIEVFAHANRWFLPETEINNLKVARNTIIPISIYNDCTIFHEFAHILGFPDLYMGMGEQVGGWDIMGSGNSFFTSATRLRYGGWGNVVEITKSGTYKLKPVDDPNSEITAYKIVGDHPNENFYIEYRKKAEEEELNLKIGEPVTYRGISDYTKDMAPNSGLIIYRHDTSVEGNIGDMSDWGKNHDEIYVFRKDETGLNFSDGDVDNAFLDGTAGRTNFGCNTTENGYNGTIYYRDGTNSKIVVKNVRTLNNGEIEFTVEMVGSPITETEIENPKINTNSSYFYVGIALIGLTTLLTTLIILKKRKKIDET